MRSRRMFSRSCVNWAPASTRSKRDSRRATDRHDPPGAPSLRHHEGPWPPWTPQLPLRASSTRSARCSLGAGPSPGATSRLCSGCFGILDGVLQAQPFMFTRDVATQVIASVGQGQPGLVSGPVHRVSTVITAHPGHLECAVRRNPAPAQGGAARALHRPAGARGLDRMKSSDALVISTRPLSARRSTARRLASL
jgi:hypothetical protein